MNEVFAMEPHVALPLRATEAMLLDLALLQDWGDAPGERREDYVLAYSRMQEHRQVRPTGHFLVPVVPDEQLLLALAGVDKFEFDSEDSTCAELDAAYDGFELMLANCNAQEHPSSSV